MLKNIHAGGIDKNGHVTVMHRSGGTSGILADYVNNAIKKEPDILIYIYIPTLPFPFYNSNFP